MDFFHSEKGYENIWPNLKVAFEGYSQEKLKECCVEHLRIDISSDIDRSKALPEVSPKDIAILRNSLKAKHPFLEYAVRNVLHHADTAQSFGISHIGFVRSFPLSEWIYLNNLFEDDRSCYHETNASLHEVGTDEGLFCSSHPDSFGNWRIEQEFRRVVVFILRICACFKCS